MYFRRFQTSRSQLQQIPPISFIPPQLCAHDAIKSSNNLSPSSSFTHSASHHPSTPFPVVPTGRFRGPWPLPFTASTAAPAARSRSTTAGVWPLRAAQCSGVAPQAPTGSRRQRLEGCTPWLSTAHPHT